MRITLVLLFIAVSQLAFSKGAAGNYHMKGVAFAPDQSILKNTELTVQIGEKITTVMTDENGNYDISVHWATACPSGLTKAERKRQTKKLNPEYVFIRLGAKEIRVENDWEKYTFFATEEREPVKKMNLEFV
jgi:hypothetical protein